MFDFSIVAECANNLRGAARLGQAGGAILGVTGILIAGYSVVRLIHRPMQVRGDIKKKLSDVATGAKSAYGRIIRAADEKAMPSDVTDLGSVPDLELLGRDIVAYLGYLLTIQDLKKVSEKTEKRIRELKAAILCAQSVAELGAFTRVYCAGGSGRNTFYAVQRFKEGLEPENVENVPGALKFVGTIVKKRKWPVDLDELERLSREALSSVKRNEKYAERNDNGYFKIE